MINYKSGYGTENNRFMLILEMFNDSWESEFSNHLWGCLLSSDHNLIGQKPSITGATIHGKIWRNL